MIFNIVIRECLKLIEPTNSIIFFLIEFERMKNEQNEIVPYPSRERISSKVKTKFNELIDSCSPLPKSGREIRNKRSAEAGPSEIYSPRPVEVNGGTKRYREKEEGIGRETVDGLAALYPTRNTGHRDPTVFDTYSRGGRETGSKILVSCSPARFHSLSRAHPVPFDYSSSNIQRNGDRFCVEFAESMQPTYLREDGIFTRGSYE